MYTSLQLRHAGTVNGAGNTTRVNLWFEAPRTAAFIGFLSDQCDAQRIQGVINVISADAQHYKAQLIVGNQVDVSAAVDAWLSGVNRLLSELPEQTIERLRRSPVDDGQARHSEDTFAWQSAAEA